MKKELDLILKDEYDFNSCENDIDDILKLCDEYCNIKELLKIKNQKIKESKDKLLNILSNKIEENIKTNGKHHIRELRNLNPSGNKEDVFKYANEPFGDKKIISVFDSSFTRMIGAKQDELSEDFMVVQVYYFDVIKDLIYYGFIYKGEKYIYFTSSAGQIRTKKTVFIKEKVWKQYERTIKVKGNRIETLFRRHKGCGHRYADGCAAKHGILLDQKRNSKRNVTFEFKRLSFSKAKV